MTFAHIPARYFCFRFIYFIILCPWASYPHVCLCTASMPGVQRGQKRVWDLLGLELQTAVRFHVGAGNQIESSARAAMLLTTGQTLQHSTKTWFICPPIHLFLICSTYKRPRVCAPCWRSLHDIQGSLPNTVVDWHRQSYCGSQSPVFSLNSYKEPTANWPTSYFLLTNCAELLPSIEISFLNLW